MNEKKGNNKFRNVWHASYAAEFLPFVSTQKQATTTEVLFPMRRAAKNFGAK